MFRVGKTVLSEEVATAKFACDVSRCKGACCVIGEAGAPVARDEIPVLKKAFRQLREELDKQAVKCVEQEGLIEGDSENGYQIRCLEKGECVFVRYNRDGVAECAIQRAYKEGRFDWEKPLSCHLYPIRLQKIGGLEYANYEYIPDLCSAACDRGDQEGIHLSDFLKPALIRRYGLQWFEEFNERCNEIRK